MGVMDVYREISSDFIEMKKWKYRVYSDDFDVYIEYCVAGLEDAGRDSECATRLKLPKDCINEICQALQAAAGEHND